MCNYYELLDIAENEGLIIIEKNFKSNAKGFCKGNKIGIKKNMSEKEKVCILAEELGHYHTTVGNILDTNNLNNQKQEFVARKWAVNELVSIKDLVEAVKSGCEYISDVADYLGITDEFLLEAIETFRAKYGAIYQFETYIVHFNDAGFSVEQNNQYK